MAKVRFTRSADRDYRRAYRWYLARSRLAATGFRSAVQAARGTLAANPKIGGRINDENRAFVLTPYPYLLIYYLNDTGDVIVVAVVHARRDPTSWVPTSNGQT